MARWNDLFQAINSRRSGRHPLPSLPIREHLSQKLYEKINVYPNPAKSGDPELTISGYGGVEETIETQVQIMN